MSVDSFHHNQDVPLQLAQTADISGETWERLKKTDVLANDPETEKRLKDQLMEGSQLYQTFNSRVNQWVREGKITTDKLRDPEKLKPIFQEVINERIAQIENEGKEHKEQIRKRIFDGIQNEVSDKINKERKDLSLEQREALIDADMKIIHELFDKKSLEFLQSQGFDGKDVLDYFSPTQKGNYQEVIDVFVKDFVLSLKSDGLLPDIQVESLSNSMAAHIVDYSKASKERNTEVKILGNERTITRMAEEAAKNNGVLTEDAFQRIYIEVADEVLSSEEKKFLKNYLQEKEEKSKQEQKNREARKEQMKALKNPYDLAQESSHIKPEDVAKTIQSDPVLMHLPQFAQDILTHTSSVNQGDLYRNEQGTLITFGAESINTLWINQQGEIQLIIDPGNSKEHRLPISAQELPDLERIMDTESQVLFFDEFLGMKSFLPQDNSFATKKKKSDFISFCARKVGTTIDPGSGEIKDRDALYKDNRFFDVIQSQSYFTKLFEATISAEFFSGKGEEGTGKTGKKELLEKAGLLDALGNLKSIDEILLASSDFIQKKQTFDSLNNQNS